MNVKFPKLNDVEVKKCWKNFEFQPETLLMITYAKVVLSWLTEETRNMTQEKWPGGS